MPTRHSAAVVLLVGVVAALMLALVPSYAGATAQSVVPQVSRGDGDRGRDSGRRVTLTPLTGQSAQPNIVVVMADDMRSDEVRFMPHLQRLIGDQGVSFANSFSPHPLCCPARASFVSGQYTQNHGVWSNTAAYGFTALDDRRTLATDLTAAGYQTLFVGKYLNGYGTQPPHDGSATSSLTYVPPGWTDWRASADGTGIGGTYNYFNTTLSINGVLRPNPGEYQTRMLGAEAADMIGQYARSPKPFFLWASFVAPHIGQPREPDDPPDVVRPDGGETQTDTPARPRDVKGLFDSVITGPPVPRDERDVSDKPSFVRELPPIGAAEYDAITGLSRQRAETLAVLDGEIADLVAELERTGELDNTVLLFTSDNGFLLGEHRIRQGKTLPYESSLRVPLLMRGPEVPSGEVRTDPILSVDLAPTLLDAAGARPDTQMDGTSLYDVARSGDRGWTRGVLTQAGPRQIGPGSLVDRDTLLDDPAGPSREKFSQGVRTPRYLYVEHASRERELYDLRTDPGQLANVVARASAAPVVRALAEVLDSLRTCAGASCRTPLPPALRGP